MRNEPSHDSLDLVRAAALRGVHQAQVMFGQMLLDGTLVERNPGWALHWFERAARSGNVMAINMVGRCFDQGWGVARSAVLAEPWFRKAAEQGLDWGMYNLATLLALGEGGIPQDRLQALHWLRRAAEKDHAKSINLIGGFYEDGWIVGQDLKAAAHHYRRSAELGDFRGQFNYARLLALAGEIRGAEFWLRKVPESATQAFLEKARAFCLGSDSPHLRSLNEVLRVQSPCAPTHCLT